MKIAKYIFLLFVPLFFLSGMSSANAYIDKKTAVIKIMNKAAGKSQTINLTVGKHTEYEKLNLLVRACKQTDPFQPEDFFMFIEISKNSEGKIFSNWMSRNDPGKSPLQNADYDLWLVKCE
ncbi:MAG TPA: DUF2155 domain-containing protein [Alphaproteobacteria bacterium]|mgnify:FL=1|nr:DUF2155 domain-containing protein [Alphaproteobacteria bacterium]